MSNNYITSGRLQGKALATVSGSKGAAVPSLLTRVGRVKNSHRSIKESLCVFKRGFERLPAEIAVKSEVL